MSAETWTYESHCPPNSADAEWRVMAGSDYIALVDPEQVMGDPEGHARLIAAAPQLERFVKTLANFEAYVWDEDEGYDDEQAGDAIATMNDLICQARELLGVPKPVRVGEQSAVLGALTDEFDAWVHVNGFAGRGDALELYHAALGNPAFTDAQREWLLDFTQRWERAEMGRDQ